MHFFFFKQKTAYEMRISDWSSDVCSSDLPEVKNICTALERKLMQIARCQQHAGIGNETDQKSNPSAASRQSPHSEGSSKADKNDQNLIRSEERRVGKECVSTCRSRGST